MIQELHSDYPLAVLSPRARCFDQRLPCMAHEAPIEPRTITRAPACRGTSSATCEHARHMAQCADSVNSRRMASGRASAQLSACGAN